MSKTKKYRLLKDTPSEKAGDIYEQRSDRYINISEHSNNSPVIESNSYFSWQVENNPEWFELIEDKIVVNAFFHSSGTIQISVSKKIDSKYLDEIKCAVEKIVNEDALSKKIEAFKNKYAKKEKTYTEQELLAAEANAFISGRKVNYYNGSYLPVSVYADFSDYKNRTNEHIKSNLQ